MYRKKQLLGDGCISCGAYDMCKAVDKEISISDIVLVEKSGEFKRKEWKMAQQILITFSFLLSLF